jgi:hypothetical protein
MRRSWAEKLNYCNTRGETRGIHWQFYSPANRRNALVKAKFRLVELMGLEPLTFSLCRHGVDLIRREHGVIDVQVAAGAPWLRRGAHMGHTVKAQPPPATETHAVPFARGPAVGIPPHAWVLP